MSVDTAAPATNGRPIADDSWLAGAAAPDDQGQPQGGQRRAARPPTRSDAPRYELRTRKPRGGQAWPFILLTGGEFAGKTTQVGLLAASGRFARTWVLPFGEDPDQYHEYDADAEVVEHDGTLYEFAAALEQIAAQVNAQPLIDGKPQLVVIDSGSPLWDLCSQIAEARARKSDEATADLMRNPYATVNIGPLNWAAVNKMWTRMIRTMKTMQAVVVMTSRAKDGVVIDAGGNIDRFAAKRGEKTYRVAVQSETPYEATAFVKLDRIDPPQVLGARVGRHGLRPGLDEPMVCDGKPRKRNGREMTFPEFSLEWLLFTLLKFDPAAAYTPQVVDPNPTSDDQPTAAAAAEPGPMVADETPGAAPAAEVQPAAHR